MMLWSAADPSSGAPLSPSSSVTYATTCYEALPGNAAPMLNLTFPTLRPKMYMANAALSELRLQYSLSDYLQQWSDDGNVRNFTIASSGKY